jgi:hypothetical protein
MSRITDIAVYHIKVKIIELPVFIYIKNITGHALSQIWTT